MAGSPGRPAIGRDPHLVVRAPDDTLARIRAFASEQDFSRSEAVRQLLERGLAASGWGSSDKRPA